MRKSIFNFIIFGLFLSTTIIAQTYPDFTITDSDGLEHTLYEDYLDKGTTVMIKVFFVDCPPCNTVAPDIQELYVEWGEGNADVQFIELSIFSSDNDVKVSGYKALHGITFPGAGGDGGSVDAVGPLLSGTFGPFFGTPAFAVIDTLGNVNFPIPGSGSSRLAAISDALAEAGATGIIPSNPDPYTVNIAAIDFFDNVINTPHLTLESEDGSVSYDIDITAPLVINDITTEYPGITTPFLRIEKLDQVGDKLSAIDLFIITKHILGKELIDSDLLKLSADANGDSNITALDLFALQRVILGKDSELPAQSSYIFVDNEVELILNPGQTEQISFEGLKVGDLNGF
ncbi:redoxin family protein [Saprospiraceae bacterium]|nr:redoxin family protein [Saprospiraceae bacterium]